MRTVKKEIKINTVLFDIITLPSIPHLSFLLVPIQPGVFNWDFPFGSLFISQTSLSGDDTTSPYCVSENLAHAGHSSPSRRPAAYG
jgi:hypothetical protein